MPSHASAALWGFLLSGSVLLGCSSNADVAEPSLGKDDVEDSVRLQGNLSFGEATTGEITKDLEFHGYLFRAGEGANVSLEITQLGSSAGFDTTLFVYKPAFTGADRWDNDAIAFDDDSGFGKLSEIESLALERQDTYLAVVGTPLGNGRGRYRLELRCDGSDCGPVDDGPACPAELEEFVRECVDEERFGNGLEEHEAFEMCTETPFAGFGDEPEQVFSDLCESAFGTPPDWCTDGVDDFVSNKIPACIDVLKPEFDLLNVSLTEVTPNSGLVSFLSSCDGPACDFSIVRTSAYDYNPAGTSGMHLARAVRRAWVNENDLNDEEFDELSVHGASERTRLGAALESLGLSIDGLEEHIDNDYELGRVDYDWNCAASVQCTGSLHIVHQPTSQEIVVIEIGGADE